MNSSNRLISLDVFRGMTMAAMILVNYPGSWNAIYPPLEHAEWAGTTPTDYIFPFFIFIVGVSITLSFTKQLSLGKSRKQLVEKALWRSVKIFSVGFLLHLAPSLNLSRLELPGVLQRIALVFLFCALLFLYTDWRTQLYVAVGILLVYWLSLMLIPVPGFGAGIIEPGKNLTNWLDGVVIPHSLLNPRGYDSEGFYSTFPAIASGISGLLAGKLILQNQDKEKQAMNFFVIGTLLILFGSAYSLTFPLIKKIWTSSYVLVTSGWAFVVFALLIWLIDVKNFGKGTKPFIIFGSNAIAIYVMGDVFETIFVQSGIRDGVFHGLVDHGVYPQSASLIWALFSVMACFGAAVLLYRRRIFIKL